MTCPDLDTWMPVQLEIGAKGPEIVWAPVRNHRLTAPFFEQTITSAMRLPGPLLFRHRTSISVLETLTKEPSPTGFIFHMSRCGSTLISQVLAATPSNRVISEAAILDSLLGLALRDPRITPRQQVEWFRGMIQALGHRLPGEKHTYFKFDCTHTLHLSLIREAFPEVPWIFLYREPVEVLVSQHRMRGSLLIPGMVDPRRFGFPFEFVTGLPHDDYTARVLGRVCAAVLDYTNGQRPCGRLVNFRELPDVIWDRLTNFFGAEYDDTERALMQKAATLNSKNPVLQHEDDTVTKQREANEVLRELADRWLRDTYQKLESRRLVACAEDR